jgi:hypothetical protein
VHRRPYDRVAHALYQAAKAAPGADRAPPAVDIHKADAARRGPPSERMLELAREHQKMFPNKSDAQAYAFVYTSRENVDLQQRMSAEQWSLNTVGDTAYNQRNNPVGRATPETGLLGARS